MANPSARQGGLAGLRIVSFESRRAQDMALLLRRSGGDVLYAPSMRPVPLADEQGILDFGARLFDGECDALVLLTGVGTTILVDALSTRWPRAAVIDRLRRTPLFCRNTKTASVVQGLGLGPALVAAEPSGPKELLALIDARFDVDNKRVFVQEYGTINAELTDGLAKRGARLSLVKIYRWALPEDTRDLKNALGGIAQRKVDAAVFTSAHQVDNVLDFSERLALASAVRDAFARWVLVISIGPVTTEALARHGIAADLVPDDPRMTPLVKSFAQHAAQLVRTKRSA